MHGGTQRARVSTGPAMGTRGEEASVSLSLSRSTCTYVTTAMPRITPYRLAIRSSSTMRVHVRATNRTRHITGAGMGCEDMGGEGRALT